MRIILIILLALVATGLWRQHAWRQAHPEHVADAPLDLDQPIGRATAIKLRALAADPARCRRLLREAGIGFAPPPAGHVRRLVCATPQAISTADVSLALAPGTLTLSCPLAAALVLWDRQVVRPAARRYLNGEAVTLETLGSWSCRRIAGSDRFSEHAGANAIDIAAIRLADGRRPMVQADWQATTDQGSTAGKPGHAEFLRAIRDGGCRLFSVVLSPDYNAAHADHLHFDLGSSRSCR